MGRARTKEGSDLRALILDYGEVLSLPQAGELVDAMAAAAGVGRERFEPAYWRHRRAYDLGRRATDYWRDTLHDLDSPNDEVIPTLIDLDVQSWTRYREPMWTLAREVRASGVKTAILSNGVPEVMARVGAERPLPELFDVVVVSYELGHAKPEREIYDATLSRLGVAPTDALFVDDRGENIAAADRLGLRTFHFTGDDRFSRFQVFLTEELSM
jgi:putative hydrolase of the HAD superfamily